MSFEKEFPSLKNKGIVSQDTIIEQSLGNGEGISVSMNDIEKYCLDKQRIREAIDNCEDDIRLSLIDHSGEDRWRLIKQILLEELGL